MPRFIVSHCITDQGVIYAGTSDGGVEHVLTLGNYQEAQAVAAELERQYRLGYVDGGGDMPAFPPD